MTLQLPDGLSKHWPMPLMCNINVWKRALPNNPGIVPNPLQPWTGSVDERRWTWNFGTVGERPKSKVWQYERNITSLILAEALFVWDLAWGTEGCRFKTHLDNFIRRLGWWLESSQFTSWALPRSTEPLRGSVLTLSALPCLQALHVCIFLACMFK